MRSNLSILLLACAILSVIPLPGVNAADVQPGGEERVIHHSKVEVDKAIQELHVTLNGRLPILDGFAEKSDQQWDRLARGYYECAVLVVANGQDEARVRVTAKITAWYTDPNPSQSGYRLLISNGRVESDLLDRIEEVFATKDPVTAAPQSSQSIRPGTSILSALGPSRPVRGDLNALSPHPAGFSGPAALIGPNSSEDIQSLKHRREEAEKQLDELNNVVQNLEEILRNQTHPTDIAVVRKSGTRVMSKPSATAPVLLSADSEDEFQVLDNGPDWVHVQISGVSRGWIRRSDLNLPGGLNGISNNVDAAAPAAIPPFRMLRQETNEFKGKWGPLNGKMVKIIWAGPESAQGMPASPLAKRDFAKSLLATAYREISRDKEIAGVVIVFDSADGGQIAATIESLTQWQQGSVSETSFWRLCSIDPPELLDR